MDQRILGYLLHVWVVVATLVGIGLVLSGVQLLVTVGTVVIIIGLISLMPAFRYTWWESESTE